MNNVLKLIKQINIINSSDKKTRYIEIKNLIYIKYQQIKWILSDDTEFIESNSLWNMAFMEIYKSNDLDEYGIVLKLLYKNNKFFIEFNISQINYIWKTIISGILFDKLSLQSIDDTKSGENIDVEKLNMKFTISISPLKEIDNDWYYSISNEILNLSILEHNKFNIDITINGGYIFYTKSHINKLLNVISNLPNTLLILNKISSQKKILEKSNVVLFNDIHLIDNLNDFDIIIIDNDLFYNDTLLQWLDNNKMIFKMIWILITNTTICVNKHLKCWDINDFLKNKLIEFPFFYRNFFLQLQNHIVIKEEKNVESKNNIRIKQHIEYLNNE